jgi:hypothetical protein
MTPRKYGSIVQGIGLLLHLALNEVLLTDFTFVKNRKVRKATQRRMKSTYSAYSANLAVSLTPKNGIA